MEAVHDRLAGSLRVEAFLRREKSHIQTLALLIRPHESMIKYYNV